MSVNKIDEALKIIVQRLVAGLDPERIILFGSHARGEASADSDLDLLIVVDESAEQPHVRMRRAYEHVGAVGCPKDFLVMTRAEFERKCACPTSLARLANDTGIVLYERGDKGRSSGLADQS
jgi:predicted nucleotidyltransferase